MTRSTRRRAAWFLPATAVVALAACAGGGGMASGGMSHVDAMSPDGEQCFQFERNAAADRLGLPWGFVRTHEYVSGEGMSGIHRAWTLQGPTDRRDYPFGMWRHVEGALEFGPMNMGSVSVRLTPDGTRMVGTGRFIGDAVSPGREIDRSPVDGVVAQQVLCGAVPGQSVGGTNR